MSGQDSAIARHDFGRQRHVLISLSRIGTSEIYSELIKATERHVFMRFESKHFERSSLSRTKFDSTERLRLTC